MAEYLGLLALPKGCSVNSFQSISSGSGILEDSYDDDKRDTQLEALRRRRQKIQDQLPVPSKDNLEGNQKETLNDRN